MIKEIAEAMGVSHAFARQIVRGERKMPRKYVKKVEKATGIPPEFWPTDLAA